MRFESTSLGAAAAAAALTPAADSDRAAEPGGGSTVDVADRRDMSTGMRVLIPVGVNNAPLQSSGERVILSIYQVWPSSWRPTGSHGHGGRRSRGGRTSRFRFVGFVSCFAQSLALPVTLASRWHFPSHWQQWLPGPEPG